MGFNLLNAALPPTALLGKNPLTSALGIDGAQGDYFHAQTQNGALDQINDRNNIFSQGGVNQGIAGYGNGSMSLQDALASGGLQGNQANEMRNALAMDPQGGSRMATDEVMNNGIQGRLYGAGADSALSQGLAQQKELSSRGFSLKPEDYEAYGQASGNIARMFGNQEQGAAQSMADRGLSAAPSGAAGATFSGINGNKFESLAQAQMGIAQQRMQMNQQRLQQAQNWTAQLGGQANQAIDNQYGRQMQGVQAQRNNLNNAAQLQTSQNSAANQANLASMEDQRAAKGHTLAEAFGQGLMSSAANIGAAPGKFASSAAGSAGKALGSGGAPTGGGDEQTTTAIKQRRQGGFDPYG